MTLTIQSLMNHPNFIPELVTLWQTGLGDRWMPAISTTEIETWYSEWLSDTLPMAYVALKDSQLVGSFSLQWNDGVRPDLSPWLGDVIVSSKYCNQGIGRQMVIFAMHEMRRLGFKSGYLFTFDERLIAYYEGLGWRVFGADVYEQLPVVIMCVDLSDN